jgi:mitochondrial fission protein ELM1
MEPLVWVLASEKVGDNAQAFALASALGWTTEIKYVQYLPRQPGFSATSAVFRIDRAASSAIDPPWPDLVIGCGRRSAALALAIRAHAGPATRLVQLGRPRTDLDAFDLVVTTPQYGLPRHPKLMQLGLPMHRIDRPVRERAAAFWRPRLGSLPRPWLAVLIGGPTRPYVFPGTFANQMAKQLNVLARAESASLLVSTSRRTPHDFAEMLAAALEVPSFVHRWDLGSDPNPYSAYLELADAFVVTGDSASMLSEACGTGRRVWFVDPPTELSATTRTLHWLGDHALSAAEKLTNVPVPLIRSLSRVSTKGWIRRPRDLRRLHAAVVEENRALPLGRAFVTPPPPLPDEVGRVAARVASLFDRTPR